MYATYRVAEHICTLDIDSKLASRASDVVEEIAKTEISGKERRVYSFATKYCSWHVPDAYPIYDSVAERLIWAYLKKDGFVQARRSDLQEYRRYVEIVERFREHYTLSEFSFKDIDKFLWLYGQEFFRQPQQRQNVQHQWT